MFPKENRWRNKKYLAWVKEQPSIVSGQPAGDAHHVKGYGLSGGVVAPDWACIPLTREEHNAFHADPEAWEERYGTQLELLMRFWLRNFDEIREFF